MRIGGVDFTGDPHDSEWYKQAACADQHPDWMFETSVAGQRAVIKDVCRYEKRECPVQAACLIEALRSDTKLGVWGGLTEHDRRGINSGKLLSILTAEAESIKADKIRRNTHPEEYSGLTTSLRLILSPAEHEQDSLEAS